MFERRERLDGREEKEEKTNNKERKMRIDFQQNQTTKKNLLFPFYLFFLSSPFFQKPFRYHLVRFISILTKLIDDDLDDCWFCFRFLGWKFDLKQSTPNLFFFFFFWFLLVPLFQVLVVFGFLSFSMYLGGI